MLMKLLIRSLKRLMMEKVGVAKSINYAAAYAAAKYLDSHLDSPESFITHIHD